MLTKNFKALMRSLLGYGSYGTTTTGSSNYPGPYGSYYGSYVTGPFSALKSGRCSSVNSYGVYFGTDSTPATENDYTLGAPITSGLSITNPTNYARSEDAAAGTVTYSVIFTVTNTSGEDINIYEIGWVTDHTQGNNSNTFYMLLDRTVLDEPINLPAGATKFITYELTFRWELIAE